MPPENLEGSPDWIPSAGITDGKITRVPNSPRTPHHSFRIPDDLYRRALLTARTRDEALTDVVRLALQAYIDSHADNEDVQRDWRDYLASGDEPETPGNGQS